MHSTGSAMIQEWGYSAKILIYHYRVILKGMIPFALAWDDNHEKRMREQCRLDDTALKYIRHVGQVIKGRGGWSRTTVISIVNRTGQTTNQKHRIRGSAYMYTRSRQLIRKAFCVDFAAIYGCVKTPSRLPVEPKDQSMRLSHSICRGRERSFLSRNR